MAVSQRVQVLGDKAEELSLLAEYLKNPKLIEELRDEIKKLHALSTEEEAKATEARQFAQKYDVLSRDLRTREDALKRDKEAHLVNAQNFSTHVSAEGERLTALDVSLEAKAKDQAETEKRHAAEKANITDTKNSLATEHAKAMALVDADRAAVMRGKDTNEAEAVRLTDLRDKLTKKSALFKEATSDL